MGIALYPSGFLAETESVGQTDFSMDGREARRFILRNWMGSWDCGAGRSETWKATLRSDEVTVYGLEAEFFLLGTSWCLPLALED